MPAALRTSLASLLIVAAVVMAGFAFTATWAQRHLLDNERWTAAVAPLIERPGVQETVATALVDAMVEAGAPGATRSLLASATARAVATRSFARVWAGAVRASHAELVASIRGDGTALVLQDRGLVVDLGALVDALKPRLSALGIPFVESLPAPRGELVLDSSPEVVRALKAARFLDRWATPAWWAAAVLAGVGIALTPRRGRVMTLAGAGLTVLGVAGLLGWLVMRGIALDGADPLGAAVLRNLTADVSRWLLAVAGVGVMLAGAGVAVSRWWGRTERVPSVPHPDSSPQPPVDRFRPWLP